jgi:hypothetical protein
MALVLVAANFPDPALAGIETPHLIASRARLAEVADRLARFPDARATHETATARIDAELMRRRQEGV